MRPSSIEIVLGQRGEERGRKKRPEDGSSGLFCKHIQIRAETSAGLAPAGVRLLALLHVLGLLALP
jgi:hypothetical protein